ncbi:thymidine kinase [Patescibacteria group bacterium]|nr:thymidine kinase [Patescibacteria group bacterium]MBU1705823.1 thymidine kinase [Patescibacteria group bacterium]
MVTELDPHLEVITGCMSSGKSEELIRRLTRAKIAELNIIVFKPAVDTRTGAEIKSRSGGSVLATIVKSPAEILDYVQDHHAVVGIDEAHFFPMELIGVVEKLILQGKHVIVSGLDLDYRGQTFGPMGELMVRAYPVHKLTAVCMKCKKNYATRSQRLVDCKDLELVGDKEYEPRCLKCYQPPSEK